MRDEDLFKFTRQQPFQPFRITTTIGETFDVRHPDMMIVSRSVVAIGNPRPGHDEEDRADTITTLAMIHIVKVEPIPTSSKSRNGKGKHK